MIKVYFKLNDVLCMKYHVTFDPKHLSGSEQCQGVTYGQCVTCFESRHVTSDPTTREPQRHVRSVCASSRVVQDFFLRWLLSVFNRFLREVHIHCGSPRHLVQCFLYSRGCSHMCFVHRQSCHKEKEATYEKCDMDCIELMTIQNLQQVSSVVGVVGG